MNLACKGNDGKEQLVQKEMCDKLMRERFEFAG